MTRSHFAYLSEWRTSKSSAACHRQLASHATWPFACTCRHVLQERCLSLLSWLTAWLEGWLASLAGAGCVLARIPFEAT
jgi:hypothetical protein